MESQPAGIQSWLAMHEAPPPPDLGLPPSPESLKVYREGVETRLHRLALLLEAMREILEQAGLLSEAQLLAKVQEIDRRDGSADGRQGEPASLCCLQCERLNRLGRVRCLYCGSADLRPLWP